MNAYKPEQRHSRVRRHPYLVAILGVLVVGGGTFAATGGVAVLKKWLVQVEINGQVVEMIPDENGEATMIVESEDGSLAEVQLQVSQDGHQGQRTEVRVRKETVDGDSQEISEDIGVRRIVKDGSAMPSSNYTLDDLGDAAPIATWEQDDALQSLYAIASADADQNSFDLFLVRDDGFETIVTLLASPPLALPENPDDLVTSIDEDGMITLSIDDGQGRQAVLKFMSRFVQGDGNDLANQPITVDTPEGEITVTVEPQDQ